MLGDRFPSRWIPIGAVAAAQAAVAFLAAAGGYLIGPMLTPNARALLLAMALVLAGCAMMWHPRRPGPIGASSSPTTLGTVIYAAALAVGDRTSFVIFALAARSPMPALAACGALVASLCLIVTARGLGERRWRALLPHRFQVAGGAVFVAFGLASAASGLRVI